MPIEIAKWRIFEKLQPEERLKEIKVKKNVELGYTTPYNIIIVHNKKWIELRDSFNRSKEWQNFRLDFLKKHPKCEECSKKASVVHHKTPFTLDLTVVYEGFLFGLQFESRFQSLCMDCHFGEHEKMIDYEKNIQ